MTDQELKNLVASLALDTQALKTQIAISQAEADKRSVEADKQTAELKQLFHDLELKADERRKNMEQFLSELGKQIGGLGNKFGSFTEGLAMPSVQQLLFERFNVHSFMPWVQRRSGAKTIELDALGLVNGVKNEAYIVEIKSHLRTEAVEQLLETLRTFRAIFPEYASFTLYGLIAAAHANDNALQAAQQAGFYVLTFEQDLMRFHDENGFVPKAY